ncbi:hypothetical protein WJ69_23060 [Burkholderia ubonensis]|uniref:DUF1376 domain-containing protein n=1 Tax=Burkholderia ubonensis TaxID=101571 RepID=UPI000758CEFE|nr:DUF1376 domain-containing protein [Burkholderia ubonensis]KVO05582.1 hypothetical protein WJ69_23060 [Burkholderia ubonensis]
MTDSLRPTPYPSDIRAKGWRFELDYERIRQSDTWALAAPEIRPWLLMLWMTAWEQTPCGSLPDDDELIAARIGMPTEQFQAIKKRLMRGWWLAADGRLYHSTMVERVLEMTERRDGERIRKANQRAKKGAEKSAGAAGAVPACPEDSRNVPDVSHGTTSGQSRDSIGTDDTGTGTSTGKPTGSNGGVGDLIRGGPVDNSASPPLASDEIVALLTQWEVERGKTPRFAVTDAPVATWCVTVEQLREAHRRAVARRTADRDGTPLNAAFVSRFVDEVLAPPRVAVKSLRSMTDVELEAEGRRLGVSTHGLARDQCVAKLDAARRAPGGHAA